MATQPETEQRLLILVALTSIYLVIPVIPFAYGWLKSPFSGMVIVVAVAFIGMSIKSIFGLTGHRQMVHSAHERSVRANTGIILSGFIIAIWLLLSGTGGFGFQNPDHLASNALLRDLIVQDWPITMDIGGETLNVVYYVAYFLPAAVVGKLFGWLAANIVLLMWMALGILLAFVWFGILARVYLLKRPSATVWMALIFCFAGGLDYAALYFVRGELPYITFHLETWARLFEYPSNTTLAYWVPQQAIAAWLLVSLILRTPGTVFVRYVGMTLAVGLIWTPLAVMGLIPYLVIRMIVLLHRKELHVDIITVLLSVSALLVGCVHALYLTSNQFKFPVGLLWNFVALSTGWPILVEFWLFEFGILSLLVLLFLIYGAVSIRRTNTSITFLEAVQRCFGIEKYDLVIVVTSLSILTLIPLFKLGYMNDLSMRASIPSLFLLWTFIAKVVISPYTQEAEKYKDKISATLQAATLMLVLLGFMTSMNELSRSIRFYSFGPPAQDAIPDSAESAGEMIERTGSNDSFFYRYLGR
jgi:hypothetical protein